MASIKDCVTSRRTSGSESGLWTNPITFGVPREPAFTRRTRIWFPWIVSLTFTGAERRVREVRTISSSAATVLARAAIWGP
jgi:hypothetical protein